MARDDIYHVPVLLDKVVEGLNIRPGGLYIDATLGGGGHAQAILKKQGKVLGIDRDKDAIEHVRENLGGWITKKQLFLSNSNFVDIQQTAKEFGFIHADGVLVDLGISSYQLDKSARGFTFKNNEPLDMRMDKKTSLTAEKIINTYSKGELYDIFSKFAEEIDSRNVSQSIIRARSIKDINTTEDLKKSLSIDLSDKQNIKKVTRVFQALRIAVNEELENIKKVIPSVVEVVKPTGRIAYISFHSLEDRLIKLTMRKYNVHELTKKPIVANYQEGSQNPRARSAKLRIYEKT